MNSEVRRTTNHRKFEAYPQTMQILHSVPSAYPVRDNEDPLPWQLYSDGFGATLAPKFGENMADMGFDGVF